MANLILDDGAQLYYEDRGKGDPIIFIHGVWMSGKFFKEQVPYFQNDYRVLIPDLRGHGQSEHIHSGHTIANYANDLYQFITKLGLKNVTLAGWSMGAFVVWEYLKQHGDGNIKATIIVDELASDFKWPDFDIGAFDMAILTSFMREIQSNQRGFLSGFIPLMFKEELKEEELDWMLEETTKLPESIASAVLFDQSVVDYRADLAAFNVPTLLCFGKEEKLIPVAAGEHLLEQLPNAKLEIFENSCHCPFLEETHKFNTTVDNFLKGL
ncbi:alpha/beta fold hydrolase [Cytobacillus purgationiresistens]|uniref:Pimeloyl-ACP methyl ester carboxylesterase n=1 Tax=Cytobacillus purgationiresistens TaxID=863449 RepID=A0ABU0AFF2_9BACI|nr:alpha/beta hydrolase [Cytobacillus purgationiresistens]MDQ0268820.1 pimeloyl-ACP methyl ester carboxylesterase [Cytobacillus purgationiresistens]